MSSSIEEQIKDKKASVSAYENQSHVSIGPSNVGKAYYMLKLSEKIGCKRPIHKITRTLRQYRNFETEFESKPKDSYKVSVVKFDDRLGARNSSQIDEFFTTGTHEALNV